MLPSQPSPYILAPRHVLFTLPNVLLNPIRLIDPLPCVLLSLEPFDLYALLTSYLMSYRSPALHLIDTMKVLSSTRTTVPSSLRNP